MRAKHFQFCLLPLEEFLARIKCLKHFLDKLRDDMRIYSVPDGVLITLCISFTAHHNLVESYIPFFVRV